MYLHHTRHDTSEDLGTMVVYTAIHILEQFKDLAKNDKDKICVQLMCNDVCVAVVALFVINCII